jgi:exodeoxyribonuclease-1
VRLCRALRPEGIEWPEHNDGRASNKLEDLSAANQLEHSHAHDALSDVRATIAVAKMLRDAQPKLYQYAFDNRGKQSASQLLSTQHKKPVLHISGMLPATQGHASLVMPLAPHPSNKNGVIVCDLNVPPDTWLALSTEELQQRLFTRADELPEGCVRPPIKVVHINRTPVLAPAGVLDEDSAQRLGVDTQQALSHRQQILDDKDAAMRVRLAFDSKPAPAPADADLQLYGGGFFSDADRRRMTEISSQAPLEQLPTAISFDDERLPVLVQRYRARNWPDSLSKQEKDTWRQETLAKLEDPTRVATTRLDFEKQVARMAINPDSTDLAQRLLNYRDALYGIESGEEG